MDKVTRVKLLVSTRVVLRVHVRLLALMKGGELVDCTIEQAKTEILGKGTIYPLYGELSQQAGTHQGRNAGEVKIDRIVQVRPDKHTTYNLHYLAMPIHCAQC